MARFDYKFVRLGEGFFGVKNEAMETYQDVVKEHARNGWRLIQIFAPSTKGYGSAAYFELIFERPS